jgi:TonB-dependent SusC/RagA subfamily outer membrane receptor
MKAFYGSGPVSFFLRLFCLLALFHLTACATTRLAEEEEPPSNDAVDVGYGSTDKDHVVGSVSVVKREDTDVVNARTFADMLAKVPGVHVVQLPGGELRVRIRGTSSLVGGAEPLYVLDGMMLQSGDGLTGLNPHSIESITVLKDAGATAIYGSRGANGVILIKTKRRGQR